MSSNKQNNFDDFELWIHDTMHQEFEISPIVMSEDLLQRTLKAVKEDTVNEGRLNEGRLNEGRINESTVKEKSENDSLEIEGIVKEGVVKEDAENQAAKNADANIIPMQIKKNKSSFLRGLRTFAVAAASVMLVIMAFKVNSLLKSSISSNDSTASYVFDTADTTTSAESASGDESLEYDVTRAAEEKAADVDGSSVVGDAMYGLSSSPDSCADTAAGSSTDSSAGTDNSGDANLLTPETETAIAATEVTGNVSWYSNVSFSVENAEDATQTDAEIYAEQALYQTVTNVSNTEYISTLSSNYAISSVEPYGNEGAALDVSDLVGWANSFSALENDVILQDQDVVLRVLLLENTDHILYLRAGNAGSVSIEDIGIDGSVLSKNTGETNADSDLVVRFTDWLNVIDGSNLILQEVARE